MPVALKHRRGILAHRPLRYVLLAGLVVLAGVRSVTSSGDHETLTLIHIGDLHGHMVPRPNVRDDTRDGAMEGGLARLYARIERLRREADHHGRSSRSTLLCLTGDTIQGSAEALFTRGQALVDVLNRFGIDAFVPGNWDFVYGTDRFIDLFAGRPGVAPLAPWGAVAANLFVDPNDNGIRDPGEDTRVLPPYSVRRLGRMRIGILGLTTDRGPKLVGRSVTRGLSLLRNTPEELDAEVEAEVTQLRLVEHVQLVVMLSEMGLANNIRLSETVPGIDVILSSDMHEETPRAVVTAAGTIISEVGQDGTALASLTLHVRHGAVTRWRYRFERVTDEVPENRYIAELVRRARRPFLRRHRFVHAVNPFNGSRLLRPIDAVVGRTVDPLFRRGFSDDVTPAVIEGSSHDFLADAFRDMAGADIGAIRGFRFGTDVRPGPIHYQDILHFMPIGAQIAVGTISGQDLKDQIEASADGSLNPDVTKWTGGWLFGYSGVSFDLDPYQARGSRASNIVIDGAPLDLSATYTYASYWFPTEPNLINGIPADAISVLTEPDGSPLDGSELVVRYLASLPGREVPPFQPRVQLLAPLPPPSFENREVQPLRGARN